MISDAKFSKNRIYRYWLKRVWDSTRPVIIFIGLNPSTADEKKNDATIRRCIGFAKRWGYGGIIMLNLFAYRATDPDDMKDRVNPTGKRNDEFIKKICLAYPDVPIVLCWGNHGKHLVRARHVLDVLKPFRKRIRCLGMTKDGQPKHPLRLSASTPMAHYG